MLALRFAEVTTFGSISLGLARLRFITLGRDACPRFVRRVTYTPVIPFQHNSLPTYIPPQDVGSAVERNNRRSSLEHMYKNQTAAGRRQLWKTAMQSSNKGRHFLMSMLEVL